MAESRVLNVLHFYALNLNLIQMQTEGLNHADSLMQMPSGGNCLNWILGHLLIERDKVLGLLNQSRLLNETITQRYAQDSEPIVNNDAPLRLEEQLELLEKSQRQIESGFHKIDLADLERGSGSGEPEMSVIRYIEFLCWHETYHTGQLELLRHLSGRHEKLI
jgi:uncharacterized damage-inducible protein DinB